MCLSKLLSIFFIRHYSHSTFPIKINIGALQDIGLLLIALEKFSPHQITKQLLYQCFVLRSRKYNTIENYIATQNTGTTNTRTCIDRDPPKQHFIFNSLEMTFPNNDIQSRQQNWVQYLVMMNHFVNQSESCLDYLYCSPNRKYRI